jgi:hypothetical protein
MGDRGGGGGGAKSYDSEKAWPSITHSILSAVHTHYIFTFKKEKVSVTAISLPCLTAVLVLVLPAFVLQTFKCVLYSSDKREREKTKKCSQ